MAKFRYTVIFRSFCFNWYERPQVLLYKHHSSVNAHKYFFSNRICDDIWNALPSSAVEASSLDCFKRLLNQVDLLQFTVLLWLCACLFCFWAYLSGYLPFMSSDLFIKLCLLAWKMKPRLRAVKSCVSWQVVIFESDTPMSSNSALEELRVKRHDINVHKTRRSLFC